MADLLSSLFGMGAAAVSLLCTPTGGTALGAIEGKQIAVVVNEGKSEVSIDDQLVMGIVTAKPLGITFSLTLSDTEYSLGSLHRVTGEMYFAKHRKGQPAQTNYLTCKRVEPLF